MHDEVRAQRERLLPQRREEGVVDDDQRAARVRRLGDRAMSTIRSSGLLGVSIHTSCGFDGERRARAPRRRPDRRSPPRACPARAAPRAAGRCRRSSRAARATRAPCGSVATISVIAAMPVQVTTAPAPPSRSASACAELVAGRIAGARVVVLARLAVAFEREVGRQIDRRHHGAVLRVRFEARRAPSAWPRIFEV